MSRPFLSVAETLEPRCHFAANPAVVSTVVNPANGHTYHLLEQATWAEAQAKAVSLGGNLVTVNDANEQAFVWSTFSPTASVLWIGYNDADRDGVYQWVNGEPVGYTNWFAAEPNSAWDPGELWATMWSDYQGAWNDLGVESPQGTRHRAVVEVADSADLFTTLSAVPTIADTGTSFAATATVRNGGPTPVGTAVPVQFYLSADDKFDDGVDVLVGSAVTDGSTLAFNATAIASGSVAVPEILTPGRYRLLAVVDPANTVAETDETNNLTVGGMIDVGATRTPVFRNLVGFVRDGIGGALNGVRVTYDGRTVYTDYDKGRKLDREVDGDFYFAKAVVGYNVSFNGAFSHFRATEDTDLPLVLNAEDLSGQVYTNTLSLSNVLPYDSASVDGGIAPTVATTALTLGNYVLRTDGGAILLHKDLQNDRNSIRPQIKPPRQLAAGRRFKDTVAAVTEKLSSLGFRDSAGLTFSPVTALAKRSAALAAVQLFEDIAVGYGAADPTSTARAKAPTGVVNESFITALNSLSINDPAWSMTLPAGWSASAGLQDGWINRTTRNRLVALSTAVPSVTTWTLSAGSPVQGATTLAGFPIAPGRAGADIAFGWINAAGVSVAGQTFWEPVVGRTTKDVKLIGGRKLAMPNPADLGITWQYRADYDQAATHAAISALLAGGNARVVFNDPQILTDLNAISLDGTKVSVIRADMTPAAGFDTQIGARIRSV